MALYFQEVVKMIRDLRVVVGRRKNTLKIRAMDSVLSILQARARASLTLAQNGVEVSPLAIQQEIYDPVIKWFSKMLYEPES